MGDRLLDVARSVGLDSGRERRRRRSVVSWRTQPGSSGASRFQNEMDVGRAPGMHQDAKNLTAEVVRVSAHAVVAWRKIRLLEAAVLVRRRVVAGRGEAESDDCHRDLGHRLSRGRGDDASYCAAILGVSAQS